MSSKDDPFGPARKTVIRATPRRERKPAPVPQEPVADGGQPSQIRDSTVFDPGVGRQTPPGWTSGTVMYQGTPLAAAPAPALRQETLLNITESVRYSAANPILAAAAPLLMLLGQLRLVPVERQAEPLAEHVAEAIDKFDRTMEKSGVAEEDARIAKFVLCETADDLIGNLPWPRKDAWVQHSMLTQFFHVEPNGTGFFEALNKVLASPEAHYDLLELMHVCLSLGFEGQYRGLTREDTNLERVRRDVFETLRYFKPRADEDISPHWRGLSATVTQSSTRLPLWVVAAAASALLTAAFFALRVFITNEGDAAADELLALNPSTPIAIERA
ncbi:MAG: DotU family type IV/VI secretion system protein, partial [Mesorhizobium sp.]